MTKIIGITGGIGSGKSTLSEYLKKLRFPVHESDKVVSKMYKKPKAKINPVRNGKLNANKDKITGIILSHK